MSEQIEFESTVGILADDNDANREYFNQVFQNTGIELHVVTNGEELVKIAQEVSPDIILTDIKMPGVGGITAIDMIRKIDDLKDIPAIAITASVLRKDIDESYHERFNEVLFKPILTEELLTAVSKAIPHKVKPQGKQTDEESDRKAQAQESLIEGIPQLTGLMEQWKNLREYQPIEEVTEFAEQLAIIGEESGSKHLIAYARDITRSVNQFDIEKMLELLEAFPEIVEKINGSQKDN